MKQLVNQWRDVFTKINEMDLLPKIPFSDWQHYKSQMIKLGVDAPIAQYVARRLDPSSPLNVKKLTN
jgi:hypothetical protein